MSDKLKLLLKQIAEERKRISAAARAKEAKRVTEVSRLVVKAGIAGLQNDFLERGFAKIKADSDAKGGGER